MQEPGQLLLQLQVQLEGAVEKTGAAAPGAELLQCLYPGLHDLWVCGEAQVVIGAQHNTALAFHHNLYILPGLEGVKIGINAFFLHSRINSAKDLCRQLRTGIGPDFLPANLTGRTADY